MQTQILPSLRHCVGGRWHQEVLQVSSLGWRPSIHVLHSHWCFFFRVPPQSFVYVLADQATNAATSVSDCYRFDEVVDIMVGICSKPATLRGEKRKMADSEDEIVEIDASSSTRLYRQRKDNVRGHRGRGSGRGEVHFFAVHAFLVYLCGTPHQIKSNVHCYSLNITRMSYDLTVC